MIQRNVPCHRLPRLETALILWVLTMCWLPARASTTDRDISLSGSVRDFQGEPLAGAMIRLQPVRNHFWDWFEFLPRDAMAESHSRADGSFVIQAPAEGLWTLSVEKEGMAPMRFELLALFEDLSLPEIVLQAQKTIRLRAIDPMGTPVRDAWILPPERFLGNQLPYFWQPRLVATQTESSGIAEIQIPRDYLSSSLWAVEHALYLPREFAMPDGGSELVLSPVSVTDSADQWLAVEHPEGDSSEGFLLIPAERRAPVSQVEEDGYAWLPNPLASAPHIGILAPENGSLGLARLAFEEQAQEYRAALPNAQERIGFIKDEETHLGVPEAFVWLARDRGIWSRTDALGAWRLPVGEGPVDQGERLVVRVDARGYLPVTVPLVGRAGDRPSLELSRAASLDVVVRAADGSSVEGLKAELRPLSQIRASTGDPLPPVRIWVDPQGGRFVARKLVPSEPYEIVVGAPGFAPVTLPWSPPTSGGPSSLNLLLEPAHRLTGRVVSAAGEPLGKVEVILVATSGFEVPRQIAVGARTRAPEIARVSSGVDGTFQIGDLPRGPVDLIARKGGYSPATRSGILFPPKGGPLELGTITLGSTLRLEGRVVDAKGKEIEGADIFLTHRAEIPGAGGREFASGKGRPLTATNAEGAFALDDLEPDRPVNLQIQKAGFIPKKLEGIVVSEENSLVIALASGGSIEGVVLDLEGRALVGASVEAQLRDVRSAQHSAALFLDGLTTRTDSTGRFQLSGVPPGDLALHVRADGFQPESKEILQLGEGQVKDLTFQLGKGVLLEGVVVTHEGAPAAGSTVGAGGHSARADESGRFSLNGIGPGETRVTARHPHHGRSHKVVQISQTGAYVELSLPASGQIISRTVDEGGKPVEGATVRLLAGGSPLVRRTDPQGTATFERVPSSANSLLLVKKEGFADAQQRVTVEALENAEVTVVLEASCTLHGRILSSREERMESLEVFASRVQSNTVVGAVDFRGEYRITGIEEGSWTVVARTPEGRRGESFFECSAADRAPSLDLELEEGFPLVAQVTLEGRPVAGSEVQVLDAGGTIIDGGRTDRRGTFATDGLKEGSYRVRAVSRERRLEASEDLRIPEMDRVEITLVQLTLGGSVFDSSSGLPVTGARLRLLTQRGGAVSLVATVSSGAQGQFRFPNVEATDLRLAIDREGFANQVVNIPLVSLMAQPVISIPMRPAS